MSIEKPEWAEELARAANVELCGVLVKSTNEQEVRFRATGQRGLMYGVAIASRIDRYHRDAECRRIADQLRATCDLPADVEPFAIGTAVDGSRVSMIDFGAWVYRLESGEIRALPKRVASFNYESGAFDVMER